MPMDTDPSTDASPPTSAAEALRWGRSELADLCSATENDPALARVMRTDEGKIGAFARGRIREAKAIYAAMAEVIQLKLREYES